MGCFVPTDVTALWPLLSCQKVQGQLVIDSKWTMWCKKLSMFVWPTCSSLMTLIIKEWLKMHPSMKWKCHKWLPFYANLFSPHHKQLPLYLCILRDPPQHKNPSFLCRGSSPNFVWSHVPMKAFLSYQMRKKGRNIKESCLCKGWCLYLCVFLRFGNTLGLMPSNVPPLGECTAQKHSLQHY
jgi:hypothetical protein